MREIKFRGKRKDDGKWVYGCLVEANRTYIQLKTIRIPISKESPLFEMFDKDEDSVVCKYEVIPETVGQYTGLLDKNGKEIYEGDILKNVLNIMVDHEPFEIVFDNDMGCWCWADAEGNIDPFYSSIAKNSVVIGNIHDNPELLEG